MWPVGSRPPGPSRALLLAACLLSPAPSLSSPRPAISLDLDGQALRAYTTKKGKINTPLPTSPI